MWYHIFWLTVKYINVWYKRKMIFLINNLLRCRTEFLSRYYFQGIRSHRSGDNKSVLSYFSPNVVQIVFSRANDGSEIGRCFATDWIRYWYCSFTASILDAWHACLQVRFKYDFTHRKPIITVFSEFLQFQM